MRVLDGSKSSIISIHALLAESDWLRCWQLAARDISIHALLAESDSHPKYPKGYRLQFLSTLSLRRATLTSVVSSTGTIDFYPRSPCGERQANAVDQILPGHISIHALLAESDPIFCKINTRGSISIHALLAESDIKICHGQPPYLISIHALLAESDLKNAITAAPQQDFYPRSPCGERRKEVDHGRF